VPNAHFNRCRSESEVGELAILHAVQKADENRNLIGDFTDVNMIFIVFGKILV